MIPTNKPERGHDHSSPPDKTVSRIDLRASHRRCGAARAQAWPDRPIHMIVPIAAGGPTDTNARIVADQTSKVLGQQVVVDNKSGAGTNIGNAFVAHAEPDGYTILYGTSSLSANGALYRALDYNPIIDLAPVSLVAKFPFFMFVPNSSPAKTVAEFIALREGKAGQADHGLARDRKRAASHRIAVHADGADPDDPRALPRRGAGLHRPHSRPHRLLFRQRRTADLFAVRPGARSRIERA